MVLKPGMNFAISRDRAPLLPKTCSVCRTHESGSSDMRHGQPRTRAPPVRPIQYQTVSPISEATPATARRTSGCSCPLPTRAPAASSTGSEGTGSPICSASTAPKTTA